MSFCANDRWRGHCFQRMPFIASETLGVIVRSITCVCLLLEMSVEEILVVTCYIHLSLYTELHSSVTASFTK